AVGRPCRIPKPLNSVAVPAPAKRLERAAEQDMGCCSVSSMPDQQQNRVRAMLKQHRCRSTKSKEAKMLEKSPPKLLQPGKAEAGTKKMRGRPFQRGNPGRPRGSKIERLGHSRSSWPVKRRN